MAVTRRGALPLTAQDFGAGLNRSTSPGLYREEDDAVAEDFGRFFEDHYGPVVRSLTLVFGDRIVAEDAAQGAFERAYRKWRSISRLGRPGTWIYVVALRDARRRLQRHDEPDDGIDPESISFEEAARSWAVRRVQ